MARLKPCPFKATAKTQKCEFCARGQGEKNRGDNRTLALLPPPSFASGPNAKAVYCTQAADGQWSLHRFKPLIQVQGGTVFAEMSFADSVLEEVKLRHFYADSELAFDYTFNASGHLVALHGSITVQSVPPPGAVPDPVSNWRTGWARPIFYPQRRKHSAAPRNVQPREGPHRQAGECG